MPKDKLKSAYSKDELEAYLLHERGHFNALGRTMSAVYSFIMILVLFLVYLIILFFDRQQYALMFNIIPFIFLFLFLGLLLNWVREYYADYYAWIHCGKKSLTSALKKIDKFKRSSFLKGIMRNYTHPPLSTRIRLIEMTKA